MGHEPDEDPLPARTHEPPMTRARSDVLLAHFAGYFGGRLVMDGANPVIFFPHGISEAMFRGLQRALIGRFRLAWESNEQQHT